MNWKSIARLHTRAVPDYLWQNYWWAYVHPTAVRIFERQWRLGQNSLLRFLNGVRKAGLSVARVRAFCAELH